MERRVYKIQNIDKTCIGSQLFVPRSSYNSVNTVIANVNLVRSMGVTVRHFEPLELYLNQKVQMNPCLKDIFEAWFQ